MPTLLYGCISIITCVITGTRVHLQVHGTVTHTVFQVSWCALKCGSSLYSGSVLYHSGYSMLYWGAIIYGHFPQ